MRDQARQSGRVLILSTFLGALLAVAVIPSARSTVGAELAMALGRRPEWARAATGSAGVRLRQVAAAHPGNVALQIGVATLPLLEADLADTGRRAGSEPLSGTVQRLEALQRCFPKDAGIRAHLLRYMTVSRVRIDRAEPGEYAGSVLEVARRRPRQMPSREALSTYLAAASQGARLEPDNAYFDAMRAAAEFAVDQDDAALQDLHAAAEKPVWDDHATEETRAQWKLLTAAYGERGVVQKEPSFSNLLLPHFAQLRDAAHLAVWHAARRARAGDLARARAIRHDVMQLGMTMAHGAPLMIGKRVGLALFEIGTSPIPPDPPLSAPSLQALEAAQREQRQRYEKELQAQGEITEADWVRAQRERGELLQSRLNQIQAEWQDEASLQYAGFGAAISPERWEGWWTFGILMLKQMGVLLGLWGAAVLLSRLPGAEAAGSAQPSAIGWAALGAALLVSAAVVVAVAPSFGLTWRSLDLGMMTRLAAGLAVFIGALRILTRRQAQGSAGPAGGHVLAGIALLLAAGLVPTVLWMTTGSAGLLQGSMLVGLTAMGVLGLAGRAGSRRDLSQARTAWKPALVALLALLPSVVLTFIARDALSFSESMRESMLAAHSLTWPLDPQSDPGRVFPALLMLPFVLLMLFQLCRVVALQLPLRTGMARGLRQTAPAAIGMLLAIYLVALVPTIAHDRAAAHRLERMLTDQLSWSPGER